MRHSASSTAPVLETVAELRELYRAAEARAARMRLVSSVGKSLSEARADTLNAALEDCAQKLAFFLGARSASVIFGGTGHGIAIPAPGCGTPIAIIDISGLGSDQEIPDDEDREAFRMALELMGSAIDRARREDERQRLVDTLQERERRLEALVDRLFSAQESERIRVSQELHDGVAQTATALARLLEGAGEAAPILDPAERGRLAGIARGLVRELRAVIGGLRPTLLDDLGLEAAVRALGDGLQDDGYRVTLRIAGDADRQPRVIETALFRVAQEAISNIRKHAGGPCAVHIELVLAENCAERFLRICDTGQGPGDLNSLQEKQGEHIGIAVMRERMSAIGGRLEWQAGEQGGVSVAAYLAAAGAP